MYAHMFDHIRPMLSESGYRDGIGWSRWSMKLLGRLNQDHKWVIVCRVNLDVDHIIWSDTVKGIYGSDVVEGSKHGYARLGLGSPEVATLQ